MIFTIKSNDGWQEIQFIQKKRIEIDNIILLLFQIDFRANNWNKEGSLHGSFDDLALDKAMTYHQVCIEKNTWDDFLDLSNRWIDKGKLFKYVFYDKLGEYLIIQLDDSNNKLISSPEKPVLSFMLKDSRSEFEFNMVIDKTSFENIMLSN